MKYLLLKFCMVVATVIATSACDSSESMKPDEIEKWIAAYSPERIDIGTVIRVESSDSLLARIDTLRSLDKVFRFSPSIEGTPRYVNCDRYIDFVPKSGSLKQGERYNCRVALSQLTGIDSLKDFSFDIVVEKRESRLAELGASIDPDNVQQVIITGKMLFSITPSAQSTDASLVECNVAGAKVSVKTTDDKLCHTFTTHGIRRKTNDFPLHIKYNPRGEFSIATSSVVIPGLSEFKMLYAERRESYVDIEFSAPLAANQELDGLITIDEFENIRIERRGTRVKVYYSVNGLTDMILRISELVKANDGRTLRGEIEHHFKQEVPETAIEVPISGTILSDGRNLTFPFRAVSLAAVDVEVVKIYTDNIMTFLQDSEIDETYRLRRVGRLIYRQTVRLDNDKSRNLYQWQNFSVDLKNLFREERGQYTISDCQQDPNTLCMADLVPVTLIYFRG